MTNLEVAMFLFVQVQVFLLLVVLLKVIWAMRKMREQLKAHEKSINNMVVMLSVPETEERVINE